MGTGPVLPAKRPLMWHRWHFAFGNRQLSGKLEKSTAWSTRPEISPGELDTVEARMDELTLLDAVRP